MSLAIDSPSRIGSTTRRSGCAQRWRCFTKTRRVASSTALFPTSPSLMRMQSSTAIPDPGEVEEVLWIPLGILASPAVRGEVTIRFGDESRDFPALRIDNRIVWGLTHRILTEFLEVIEPLEGLG